MDGAFSTEGPSYSYQHHSNIIGHHWNTVTVGVLFTVAFIRDHQAIRGIGSSSELVLFLFPLFL